MLKKCMVANPLKVRRLTTKAKQEFIKDRKYFPN